MRRIAVNGAILHRGLSGIARMTTYLIDALGGLPDIDVRVVSPVRPRSRSSVVNALQDTWWDLRGAEHHARAADLLVSPCNLGRATRIPNLLCVADIMPIEHPEYFDRKFAAYFRALLPYSLRRASRVMTNTEHVRRKLLQIAPKADVHVVPLPSGRTPRVAVPFPDRTKDVLVVGATAPHKNQSAAVNAVDLLRQRTGEDVRLHIVGPPGHAEHALAAQIGRLDREGRWITRHVAITDEALERLYASAWILVQPSIDEGYGLPLVEAAEHGLPAVHSGAGAMSEVAPLGNARGTDAASLLSAMAPLLERSAWKQHAVGVREIADRKSVV